MDPEFQENIEQYFVENIKVGHFYVDKGGCLGMVVGWQVSENAKVRPLSENGFALIMAD